MTGALAIPRNWSALRDRVSALTRWVSLVITPFLVVAFVVLVPWPRDTARLFAWDIKPTLTPMVLGSVYLGGAYFLYLRMETRLAQPAARAS